MALPKDFPKSPHAILDPEKRWTPSGLARPQRELIAPLVAKIRKEVKAFRDSDYAGATETSKSLLKWWFETPHLQAATHSVLAQKEGELEDFQYYFAQREALETIIYLHDLRKVKDKHDMLRFDSSGAVSLGMFPEDWPRFLIKMATGTGKTKVMSLALAWSYFHKLYEPESDLARNFLVIAPNIIVLDRLYRDFNNLRIFHDDPVLPTDGYEGRDWQADFQMTLHRQDDVTALNSVGNIFLTNIHRVYSGDVKIPSADDDDTMDYFLGEKPVGETTDSKIDLGDIVRNLEELMVINDEAHHIHNEKMAWFTSIRDIHNKLLQKKSFLSMQLDVTATPKHNNGSIFVQTVSDYHLMEAIHQSIVKHPTLPDQESLNKLVEKKSLKFVEEYEDYINLGVIEWKKSYDHHIKVGKKAVLFIMADNTRNCDDVVEYLESRHQDYFKGKVLKIHTKNNGEISEPSKGKKKEELDELRAAADNIDSDESDYVAIVSVLMLKEGWDVRNVTTIVGLRPYSSESQILPEQTLGRGLRKMYTSEVPERVSVIGTRAFIDFVKEIEKDGVKLDYVPMGPGPDVKPSLIIEIDNQNPDKDISALDIQIPTTSPRLARSYKDLDDLDVGGIPFQTQIYKQYGPEELREITFRAIEGNTITHTTILDPATVADFSSVIGFFARLVMERLHLFSGYDILYGKIKEFVKTEIFGKAVDLKEANTIRNLSEEVVMKTVVDTFIHAINAITIKKSEDVQTQPSVTISEMRPFVAKQQESYEPRKSPVNHIIGNKLERDFAEFLDDCPDVASFTKLYFANGFKLDYMKESGELSNYYPDFSVKLSPSHIVIAETKGREDINDARKLNRLRQWCEDMNALKPDIKHDFVFVEESLFRTHRPTNFAELMALCTKYKT